MTMSNKLAESGEGSDPLRDALKVVYSAVENVPEPIVPVGDEQHAMTGHVVLRSFYKLLVTLQNDLHPSFRPSGSSVFLDVGSGMGRPVLSFACLPIKASIGIELQGLPTAMSCVVLRQLYHLPEEQKVLKAQVMIQRGDILEVKHIDTVTHVYSFSVGMPPNVLQHIITLAACSSSVRVLMIFDSGRGSSLRGFGLLDPVVTDQGQAEGHGELAPGEEIRNLSMEMPGGRSYCLYIVPMTERRRARIQQLCGVEALSKRTTRTRCRSGGREPLGLMEEAWRVFEMPKRHYEHYFLDEFMQEKIWNLLGRTRAKSTDGTATHASFPDNPAMQSILDSFASPRSSSSAASASSKTRAVSKRRAPKYDTSLLPAGGQVVWAKVASFPFWPARVVSLEEYGQAISEKRQRRQQDTDAVSLSQGSRSVHSSQPLEVESPPSLVVESEFTPEPPVKKQQKTPKAAQIVAPSCPSPQHFFIRFFGTGEFSWVKFAPSHHQPFISGQPLVQSNVSPARKKQIQTAVTDAEQWLIDHPPPFDPKESTESTHPTEPEESTDPEETPSPKRICTN